MIDESEYIRIARENLIYKHLLRECCTVIQEIQFQVISQKVAEKMKKELHNQDDILDSTAKLLKKMAEIWGAYTYEF